MRIHVAGSLTVTSGDRLVRERDLPGGQGRVVLAMLAVEHRRAVARDELAEELWPEHLPRSWETALRAIVSKLRTSLTAGGVPANELIANAFGCYQLRLPSAGWLDIDAARDALHDAEIQLTRGQPGAATANALVTSLICRRPFLSGHYGPWALSQRDRLQALRLRAEECLAEAFAATGDYERSARAAEQALTLDPYRERLYQRLMRTHALAGDRAAAAHTYMRCRELFARELGIQPTPTTIALFREAVASG